jgi:BNR repeat protein
MNAKKADARSVRSRVLLGMAACVVILAQTSSGLAASMAGPSATSPRSVTGTTPLPRFGQPGACGSDLEHQDWESEPALAVNPADERNLVTAWIQDWNDAISIGTSTDAGKSWTTTVPKTAACTWPEGAPSEYRNLDYTLNSAGDPWIAIGPAPSGSRGIAYLSSLVMASDNSHFLAVAHHSEDGGRTWSDPVIVDKVATPLLFDMTNIAADPRRPGVAYMTYDEGDLAGLSRAEYVVRTTDGGITWSDPVAIPVAGALPVHGQLSVLQDGSVVDVFGTLPPEPGAGLGTIVGPTTLFATRSVDGGEHWSAPVLIAVADPTRMINAGVATASDGTLHVGWARTDANGMFFQLLLATSTDGGRTWSNPRAVGAPIAGRPGAGDQRNITSAPSVSVNADGTIAVAFYDHRRDADVTDTTQFTDRWVRTSSDGGATWSDTPVAGPFDQSSAPQGGGIGDSQGIAPVRGGFAMTFTLARPLGGANFNLASPPTDIFFSRFRLKGAVTN